MSRPTVDIDPHSGFCHGVVQAIAKAEEELARTGRFYCLGDIVHNSTEVERLQKRGLQTITHADLESLQGVKVLLRAHGEPPATYATAQRRNIEIVDATCPVVLKLQQRIHQSYATAAAGTQIVIYGKPGHAEVNGLVGQTDGHAIVVQNIDDLVAAVDFSRNIELYSQTTKSLEGFRAIIDEINRHKAPGITFRYYDTICRQVSNRVPRQRAFAAEHDVVLFVSGAKSSNGRVLYEQCRQVNSRTHLISGPSEVEPEWVRNVATVGICGATSTPRWLMEQVRDRVNQIIDNQ